MAIVRIPSQLGVLLRDARLQRGLTLAQVARDMGVSTQAISWLERHADRASFTRVHRLCLLLGLQIDLQPKPTGVAESPGEW